MSGQTQKLYLADTRYGFQHFAAMSWRQPGHNWATYLIQFIYLWSNKALVNGTHSSISCFTTKLE